jgi:class 3 adenylate cyclase
MKPEPVRFDRQVLSALFVGGAGGAVFSAAVREMLGRRYGAAAHPEASLAVGLIDLLAIYGAAWIWARPLARFLDTRDESLRAVAQRRYDGLYRLLLGLWAADFLVSVVWIKLRNPSAPWPVVLLPDAVEAYFGAYFTVIFLEPLLITKAARFLYTEPEIFRRKEGPLWTVRAKLFLLVVNLILLPLAFVELIRRTGGGSADAVPVIAATFLFAAGYLETLYRSIARPLAQLGEKMALVAKGDYSAKTIVLDDDEIGELKAGFNDMVDGLAERERLKDTFGRYVSVEVAKRLVETGAVSLGGESIEATILFSDIRDFTAMSERMPAQELVAFLNEYFSYVTEPIAAHNGMINKFIGDAVMAVFAPQFGSKDHVDDAVRAALGMRAKLAELNARGGPVIRFGVGIHTGTLVAGNIGTKKRLEYTVIGDTVNVASRIESSNKELGSVILISEAVHSRLSPALRAEVRGERCDDVKVKGRAQALVLYKVL